MRQSVIKGSKGGTGVCKASPVTHMPEKLYMSSATISMSSTMAIGLEWNIICSMHQTCQNVIMQWSEGVGTSSCDDQKPSNEHGNWQGDALPMVMATLCYAQHTKTCSCKTLI